MKKTLLDDFAIAALPFALAMSKEMCCDDYEADFEEDCRFAAETSYDVAQAMMEEHIKRTKMIKEK